MKMNAQEKNKSLISARLKEKGISFTCGREEEMIIFTVHMPIGRTAGIQVHMILSPAGDIALCTKLVCDIEPKLQQTLMTKANALNFKHRFICVFIDDEGDLAASYDALLPEDEESVGQKALMTLLLFTMICNSCISEVMPYIWGNNTKTALEEELDVLMC